MFRIDYGAVPSCLGLPVGRRYREPFPSQRLAQQALLELVRSWPCWSPARVVPA